MHTRRLWHAAVFVFVLLTGSAVAQQQQFPFQNPDLPLEQRLDDLMSRLTMEEKVAQTVYDAPAIPRLGIPSYNWWSECLHGVARAGLATVFPQAIGLAATFDADFMHQVATAISDEARAKHNEFVRHDERAIYEGLTFWSPNINIFRDPRWGRGQETYGEDPYLTSRMAVAFIRGLQGDNEKYLKLVATAKHYAVHSGPEPERHTFDAQTDQRDLLETYLPAFEASVEEANAQSVMCAYNAFRGDACCGSKLLLEDFLRRDWKFDGYVVSDCGAIRDIFAGHKIVDSAPKAAALAVEAGTDLNCGRVYTSLNQSLSQDLISADTIDQSVRRLFRARFRLGMFDPPSRVPYTSIPYSVNNSDAHKALALEAGRKSIVLLKNENGLLPLSKEVGAVAVIGPNANRLSVLEGNYYGSAERLVTVLDGIRHKVAPSTKVYFAQGCEIAAGVPPVQTIPSTYLYPLESDGREQGLTASYYKGPRPEGQPVVTRVDPVVDFTWVKRTPVSNWPADEFSARWEGFLVPPVSGTYRLGANGLNVYRLSLDGQNVVSYRGIHESSQQLKSVDLEAGRFYKVALEFSSTGAAPQIQLVWSLPVSDYASEALDVARRAEVVIFVGGLTPHLEGEEMPVHIEGFSGGDRTELRLPRTQEDLLAKLVTLGKPVVCVLLNGSAVASAVADASAGAILTAWYPGQSGGEAVADVLFGDYNPAGRLPVTFYESVSELPPFDDYSMKGRTYRYFDGPVLYPFGFGLSYTRFQYGDLAIDPGEISQGGDGTIKAVVKNVGEKAGEEVVELYVRDLKADVPVPIRSLAGFTRVRLEPGESRTVEFPVTAKQLSLINAQNQRVLEPGDFEVSVGGEQPGFSGHANAATTDVVQGTLTVEGSQPIPVK
ncbi:MAG: glycoside hydrolase family 3 C-terminal domain-containing protein [Acidobacteriota bacterium]